MLASAFRHPTFVACLAGAAWAFGAAPTSFVPLLFAGMYLWVHALSLEANPADPWRGAKLGFACGMGFHIIAFYWAYPLFRDNVPIPVPVAIALTLLTWFGQALPFAFAGAMAEAMHGARLPRSLSLAIALPVALEHVFMVFPWRPSELTIGYHAYSQIADLSGPSLLDAALVLGGAATLEGLATRRRWLFAVGALAVVVPFVYGAIRIDEVNRLRERAPIVRVGAVQPNIAQSMKFQPRLANAQLVVLRRLTAGLERRGVDLTAWPETANPYPFLRDRTSDTDGMTSIRNRGEVRGPVVFGTLSSGGGRCQNRNSVVAMDARGAVVGLADKVMLFPFSEQVPFWEDLRWLHPFVPCPGFVPGAGPSVLRVAGSEIGILNCYEDLMPGFVRQLGLRHADFLLNLTNDAWFMDTSEPHLHHMAARLRAIEVRRDLVRVVNTGLTGHVDATGARVDELPVWREGSAVFEVRRLPDTTTPFMRYGDWAVALFRGLFLVACAVSAVRSLLSGAGRGA